MATTSPAIDAKPEPWALSVKMPEAILLRARKAIV
jgi:hypothetical protein